jgi:hypothetical protein
LVEREQVKEELGRLMEQATDEAARRGKAATARTVIEKGLDDLSTSLFDQSNTMVTEAFFLATSIGAESRRISDGAPLGGGGDAEGLCRKEYVRDGGTDGQGQVGAEA